VPPEKAYEAGERKHTADLKSKLEIVLRDAKAGAPVRGGVLGRVAEFLVAQRASKL
jgi:hypothetical protein